MRVSGTEHCEGVADKLPRPNLVLLKHLLSLLHHISQNAETTRMDSSNLAICVGPNMLGPETDSTLPLEVQKEMNDKLFDFDIEVKPILEVLVGKTIEQALLEVMEEEELAQLWARQRAYAELRNAELAEAQRLKEQDRRYREVSLYGRTS
ncbi:t-cell activation rho gtpase-activating hypothetical protein [Limosa lapponica baueri]|uniref:Rho-GAP domain-containing protein n=1 Tax=Limosa lapponica baueri TaxID=1758121 RepID=A0A2I0TWM3_LIMLA|nr:t-cell activation rho gtpase-activating hypothetical protein [Limosa lapponica baueri]